MTSAQKVAVSLLVSIVAFAIFTVIAFTGLFNVIDARFYEPAKVNGIRKQLDAAADASETYINSLIKKFASGDDAYLSNSAVMSYFDSTPSDENVEARANVTGNLFVETQGLDGIRIVASNGRNVHFSTYSNDIIRQNENMKMYRDYVDLQVPTGGEEIPFEQVSAPDNMNSDKNYRLAFDAVNNRIIFSFPFYDSYSAYRGTALFYVNAFDFNRALSVQNIVPLQYNCTLVASEDGQKAGFVFGLPAVGSDLIRQEIIKSWNTGSIGPDKILNTNVQPESEITKTGDNYWVLLTSTHVPFLYLAGVYRDTEFAMLPAVRIVLLVCVFITLFLIVFMVFSFKSDDMVVIRDKIKRLQFSIINEYLDNREKVDWQEISNQIAGRKYEVSARIKKSLGKRVEGHEAETDALIDRSWNEIIGAIGIASPNSSKNVDVAQIKKILEEVLASGNVQVKASLVQSDSGIVVTPVAESFSVSTPTAVADELEEVEELDEVESLEEAEAVEDLETLEEVEPLEDVPQELEEVEELDKIEPVEELETLEEAEPLEDVPQELEDVEELDEIEPVEELETLEEAEPLEDIPQELEDVEELDEIGPVEELETLEEVEPLEDIPQELEDVDELEEVDTLEKVETVDDIEPLEKIVDEIEEIPIEIEDIDDAEYIIGKTEDKVEELTADSSTESNSGDDVSSFNVVPVSLDFSNLDEPSIDVSQSSFSDKISATRHILEEKVFDLQFVSKNQRQFNFTGFKTFSNIDGELAPYMPEVIFEDENGIFHISDDLVYNDVQQNDSFKNLVDSVMK